MLNLAKTRHAVQKFSGENGGRVLLVFPVLVTQHACRIETQHRFVALPMVSLNNGITLGAKPIDQKVEKFPSRVEPHVNFRVSPGK